MSKATLKINSYQNSNAILINDKIIFDHNALENYKTNSPIISKAENLLYDIYREYNSSFLLEIEGNVFERTFLSLCCELLDQNIKIEHKSSAISLSSQKRIELLLQLGAVFDYTIPLTIETDITGLELPSFKGIKWAESSENRIIISNNKEYICSELIYSNECAFYIDGLSEKIGDKYIIGCSQETIQELIYAYIETKYVNPLIGKLFSSVCKSSSILKTQPQYNLIDRVSPYFYITSNEEYLTCFVGETNFIKLHSYSTDYNGEFVFDSPETFETITTALINNSTNPTIELSIFEPFKVLGLAEGSSDVLIYYDDSQPLARVNVLTKNHILINSLFIELESDHKLLLGNDYAVKFSIYPENAEDINSIEFTIDNTEVAEIVDSKIHIKQYGSFTIRAKSTNAQTEETFEVYKPVEKIVIRQWPEKNIVKGKKQITVNAEVFPKDATNHTVHYKINSKNPELKVSTHYDLENIFKISGNNTSGTITFYTPSNPSVSIEKKITFKNIKYKSRFFASLGSVLLFVSAIFLLFRSTLVWTALALALVSCLFACFRPEINAKKTLLIITILSLLIGYLRINVFYDIDLIRTSSKITQTHLNELKSEVDNKIYDEKYEYSPQIISSNRTEYSTQKVTYLGYCFELDNNLIFPDKNYLYLIYRVKGVSPSGAEMTFYSCATVDEIKLAKNNDLRYNKIAIEGYKSLSGVLQEKDNWTETTLKDKVLYKEYNLNKYALKTKNFSKDLICDVANSLASKLKKSSNSDIKYSKAEFYEAIISIADTPHSKIYSNTKNEVYIYLSQDEYVDGKYNRTHYYKFTAENVELNNDNMAKLDLDVFSKPEIVTDLEESLENAKSNYYKKYKIINITP